MAASRMKIIAGPNFGTNAHPSNTGPEGATQTFLAGAALVASSGQVIEATSPLDDDVALLGFAEDPASGVTDKDRRFLPALPQHVFEGSLDDSGDLGAGEIAATDLFAYYGLAVDSDGVWYVDKSGGPDQTVVIVGFRDPVGAVMGRVYFQVVNAANYLTPPAPIIT